MNPRLNRNKCYLRIANIVFKPKEDSQPRQVLESFKSINLAKKFTRKLKSPDCVVTQP